jgi:hypothetical protein
MEKKGYTSIVLLNYYKCSVKQEIYDTLYEKLKKDLKEELMRELTNMLKSDLENKSVQGTYRDGWERIGSPDIQK